MNKSGAERKGKIEKKENHTKNHIKSPFDCIKYKWDKVNFSKMNLSGILRVRSTLAVKSSSIEYK